MLNKQNALNQSLQYTTCVLGTLLSLRTCAVFSSSVYLLFCILLLSSLHFPCYTLPPPLCPIYTQDHALGCPLVTVSCPHMCSYCCQRCDLPSHLLSCSNKPTCCPTCSIHFPHNRLDEHTPYCSRIAVSESLQSSLLKVCVYMYWYWYMHMCMYLQMPSDTVHVLVYTVKYVPDHYTCYRQVSK